MRTKANFVHCHAVPTCTQLLSYLGSPSSRAQVACTLHCLMGLSHLWPSAILLLSLLNFGAQNCFSSRGPTSLLLLAPKTPPCKLQRSTEKTSVQASTSNYSLQGRLPPLYKNVTDQLLYRQHYLDLVVFLFLIFKRIHSTSSESALAKNPTSYHYSIENGF